MENNQKIKEMQALTNSSFHYKMRMKNNRSTKKTPLSVQTGFAAVQCSAPGQEWGKTPRRSKALLKSNNSACWPLVNTRFLKQPWNELLFVRQFCFTSAEKQMWNMYNVFPMNWNYTKIQVVIQLLPLPSKQEIKPTPEEHQVPLTFGLDDLGHPTMDSHCCLQV